MPSDYQYVLAALRKSPEIITGDVEDLDEITVERFQIIKLKNGPIKLTSVEANDTPDGAVVTFNVGSNQKRVTLTEREVEGANATSSVVRSDENRDDRI